MSSFDIKKLFINSKNAIKDFARDHQDETFYAFCVKANMLCLNSEEISVEHFDILQKTLPGHMLRRMKLPIIWFFLIQRKDSIAIFIRYLIPFNHQGLNVQELSALFKSTDYHKSMSMLVQRLVDSNIFNCPKKISESFA